MQTIIKHNQVIEDHWTLLGADAELAQALSTAQPIITLALWQAHKSELQGLTRLGIWLEADQAVEDISEDLAIGDVLRDQLFFMQRCGFDAYVIRADRCPTDALKSLTELSVSYQAAYDQSLPLYRRRSA